MNNKKSGNKVVADAAKILRDTHSSRIQKSLAASVISQSNSSKVTGKTMETKASQIMQSNKYSKVTKGLAASVLSQSDKSR